MKKIKYKETLTATQLEQAEIVPAYRHPKSARTVARHHDGEAYTVTGLHCGPIDKAAAEKAAEVTGDGSGAKAPAASDTPKTAGKPPAPPKK